MQDEESRGEHVTTLLFCICGPLAFNWFMSLMKTLFGGKEWPSAKTFFMVTLLYQYRIVLKAKTLIQYIYISISNNGY